MFEINPRDGGYVFELVDPVTDTSVAYSLSFDTLVREMQCTKVAGIIAPDDQYPFEWTCLSPECNSGNGKIFAHFLVA